LKSYAILSSVFVLPSKLQVLNRLVECWFYCNIQSRLEVITAPIWSFLPFFSTSQCYNSPSVSVFKEQKRRALRRLFLLFSNFFTWRTYWVCFRWLSCYIIINQLNLWLFLQEYVGKWTLIYVIRWFNSFTLNELKFKRYRSFSFINIIQLCINWNNVSSVIGNKSCNYNFVHIWKKVNKIWRKFITVIYSLSP
jgi:hypothetical protein